MNYWKILEYADWGNNTDHKAIRADMDEVFTKKAMELVENFYRIKLQILKDHLELHAYEKTGNFHGYYGVSDDGFWDLRAHIIGLGEVAYNDVFENPELAKVMADNKLYVENFGYIFN